jgi:hypothetical protein
MALNLISAKSRLPTISLSRTSERVTSVQPLYAVNFTTAYKPKFPRLTNRQHWASRTFVIGKDVNLHSETSLKLGILRVWS